MNRYENKPDPVGPISKTLLLSNWMFLSKLQWNQRRVEEKKGKK